MKRYTQCAWLPACLGVILAVGGYSATHGSVNYGDISLYIQCVMYAALACAVFPSAFLWFDRLTHDSAEEQILDDGAMNSRFKSVWRVYVRFEYSFRRNALLRDALRMFVCWAPYLVLLYPGILYWDTGDQVAQFFGLAVFGQQPGQIWDHHPFLDTYLYGSVIWLGHAVSGSYEIGIFIYVVLQSFAAGIAVCSALTYLNQRGLNRKILKLITAFFCVFPLFPIMFSSMVKDTTHAVVFLVWLVMYMVLVDSKLEKLRDLKFSAGFLVISLLAMLTKRIGLYVIVVALLLLVFGRFKTRLKAVCVALAVILFGFVSVFLPHFLYPALHIVPAERHAGIVVPIQMVARVAHTNPDGITQKEKQALNDYLPMTWDEMGKEYRPFSTDPVTGYMMKDTGSFVDFAKAWITVGLKYPLTYIQAFVSVESGWMAFNGAPTISESPEKPYPEIPLQYQPITSNQLNKDTFGQLVPNRESTVGQSFVKGATSALQAMPVVNALMYIALWTTVIPAYALYSAIRRRVNKDEIFRVMPYWLTSACLFLCPVTIQGQNDHSSPTRYAFQAMVLGAFMLGITCISKKDAVRQEQ